MHKPTIRLLQIYIAVKIRNLFRCNKQDSYFGHAALVKLLMKFTLVVAVGGIGFEDVAVARFQHPIYSTFLDCAGADVIGQDTEQQRVIWRKIIENRNKLSQILS